MPLPLLAGVEFGTHFPFDLSKGVIGTISFLCSELPVVSLSDRSSMMHWPSFGFITKLDSWW